MKPFAICALYKFVPLDDIALLRHQLLDLMTRQDIRGTLLLAREGINGTVAGSRQSIDALLAFLDTNPGLADLQYKKSYDDENPFHRAKVRLKKEIVTMGVEDIDPRHAAGTYVEPKDWNELICDPETLLIDTRNEYEVEIGSFRNAVNPQTKCFRDFPDYVKQNLDPSTHRKIAMFCTGGIRCEKSTAYLRKLGFEDVYHLKGGILRYLEEVPKEESMWEGECFVFDNRVAVDHTLEKGHYDMCHACRMPLSEADKQSAYYVEGVSCPHCHTRFSDERRKRFMERQRQIKLARKRGEKHIGGSVTIVAEMRRIMKRHR